MKKHNIFIIHGIGNQGKGYSNTIKKLIKEEMGSGKNKVNFVEVLYADLLGERIKAFTIEEKSVKGLGLHDVRKMFNEVAYDAIAYGYKKSRVIKNVQNIVNAHQEEGCSNTFIAHSLGGLVLYDFLYRSKMFADNIFTLGTPLALRILGGKKKINVGFWLNIVGSSDVIGKPLKTDYMDVEECDSDHIAPVGTIVQRRTPLCHTAYWNDDNVIKPIAYKISMDIKGNFDKKKYFKKVSSIWKI